MVSKGIYRSPAYVADNAIICMRVCEHFATLAARLLLVLAPTVLGVIVYIMLALLLRVDALATGRELLKGRKGS